MRNDFANVCMTKTECATCTCAYTCTYNHVHVCFPIRIISFTYACASNEKLCNTAVATDAQSSGTPELAFADGYPVALGDVTMHENVTFECHVYNSTAPVTEYKWIVTAADEGGSPWTCYDTSSSMMTCTVINDCTMNVTCTPFMGFIGGNPGSIDVTVEGKLHVVCVPINRG